MRPLNQLLAISVAADFHCTCASRYSLTVVLTNSWASLGSVSVAEISITVELPICRASRFLSKSPTASSSVGGRSGSSSGIKLATHASGMTAATASLERSADILSAKEFCLASSARRAITAGKSSRRATRSLISPE
jgi:hypothetical protein